MSARRNMRPRPQALYMPPLVSTRSLASCTEIPERRFREALAKHPEVPRSLLGRDLLLSADAVLQLLDVLRVEAGEGEGDDDDRDHADQPTTPDAVLRALGMRRTS